MLLILTPQHVPGSIASKTMLVLAAVSLALNGSIPLIILLFTIFPKKMMRLVVGAVGLLAKMHIVKRKYHATKKCVNGLLEYSGAMKLFAKKFLQCLPLVLLCVIETLLNYAIPFFVVLAVGHDVKPTFELLMQILCLSTLTRYTALLIPTPGNTGAMEATGSLIFSTVTSIQPMLGWVVLVWRFFTYYIYILSGIGISISHPRRRTAEEKSPRRNRPFPNVRRGFRRAAARRSAVLRRHAAAHKRAAARRASQNRITKNAPFIGERFLLVQ